MASSYTVYVIITILLWLAWFAFFAKRQDLRKEMAFMSVLVGFLNVIASYYGWSSGWWSPLILTGTNAALEDFVLGFFVGGIIAVIYEVIFKQVHYARKATHHSAGAFTLLILIFQAIVWAIYVAGFSNFWSVAGAMVFIATVMLIMRHDLFKNAVLSGALITICSLAVYIIVSIISPAWMAYSFMHDASFLVLGIPVEELAFWFLAGAVFGPFYEYWQGERLKKMKA